MLKKKFISFHEFEDYEEMILKTDILITASPQAILESLASNGRPIFIKREDYTDDFDELFTALNIPIINNYNKNQLSVILKTIKHIKYLNLEDNSNKIRDFIKENLNL